MSNLTRDTKITQKLDIKIDLGEVPIEARPPKVRVRRKLDGREMFLNEKEFKGPDAEKFHRDYDLILDYDPDAAALAAKKPIVIADSLYTADDMASMTVKELQGLPEWTRLSSDEVSKLTTKNLIVEALLATRRNSPNRKKSKKGSATEEAREAL